METDGRLEPPRILEALLERILPSAFDHVAGDLAERYRSPWGYIRDAALVVPCLWARELGRGRVRARRAAMPRGPVWMAASAGLLFSGVAALPVSSPGPDFVLGALLMGALAIGHRHPANERRRRRAVIAVLALPIVLAVVQSYPSTAAGGFRVVFHVALLATLAMGWRPALPLGAPLGADD